MRDESGQVLVNDVFQARPITIQRNRPGGCVSFGSQIAGQNRRRHDCDGCRSEQIRAHEHVLLYGSNILLDVFYIFSPPSRRGGRADRTDVSLPQEIGAAGGGQTLVSNGTTPAMYVADYGQNRSEFDQYPAS